MMTSPLRTLAVLIGCLVLAAFVLRGFQRPCITGDGVGYYAPLASLLVDGDLDLRNELQHLERRYLVAAFGKPDGTIGDPFPVGPAHLWSPAALLVRALPDNARLDAPVVPPARTRHPAFAPRYARAILWTSQVLVVWSAAALGLALVTTAGTWLTVFAVCAGVLGTPVFFYVLQDPSYGHTASFFAVSLFVAAILLDRRRALPPELLGIAFGLVVLMRSQDAVLGVLLLPRLWDELRAPRGTFWAHATRTILRVAVPTAVLFTPQMVFWQHMYGRPLLVPPGPDLLPWWKPHVLHLLFSTWNGAVLWSPLLALGCLGVLTLPDRGMRWALIAALVLEAYTSSLLLDWWGGRAFGARRLVSIAPLVIVGVAYGAHHLRARRRQLGLGVGVAVAALACLWNLHLASLYRDGLLPGNPGNAGEYLRHPGLGPNHATPYGHWDYARLLREVWRAQGIRREAPRR